MNRKTANCLVCALFILVASALCPGTGVNASNCSPMNSPVNSFKNSPVNSLVTSSMNSPANNPVTSLANSSMNSAMNDPVNSPVYSPGNAETLLQLPVEFNKEMPVEFNKESQDIVSVIRYHNENVHIDVAEGPGSFFARDDKFYIVDNVNERIVIDKDNSIIQDIKTPRDEYNIIIDIYVDPSGNILILNDRHRFFTIDLSKSAIARTDIPRIEAGRNQYGVEGYYIPERICMEGGRIAFRMDDGNDYYLDNEELVQIKEEIKINRVRNSLIHLGVGDYSLKIESFMRNSRVDIGSRRVRNTGGKLFVSVLEYYELIPGKQEIMHTIRKFDGDKFVGVATLRGNNVIRPYKQYYIDDDGNLLQKVITREHLTIYKLKFLSLEEYARDFEKRNGIYPFQGCKIWAWNDRDKYTWDGHSWGSWYLCRTYCGAVTGETVNEWRRECLACVDEDIDDDR